jgi:signal transduction histidine kinase
VILQPDEQGSDLITLARLCKFEAREDAFLFVPGLDSQGRTLGAVLMALPATGAMWGQEEQLRLHKIMNLIVQHIARNQSISMLNEQAAKIRQSDAVRRSQLMRPDPEPSMSNELRLALEEISILRASLAEWEAKAASAGLPSPETPPDFSHLDHIVHIAQDMQQPLASLQDYTEILLGEQFGVLAEKQQKNLERIRMSSKRISRLANELVQVVSVEKQLSKLSIKELDLGALIVQVKERLSVALDEKQIAIKIDQSQQGFSVYSDMQALSMILEQVLHYCISFTPVRGQITLAARLEHKDGSPDYALIQWMSSVDVSNRVDLSQVFSQKRGAKPEAEEDAATGANLFKVHSLVEALGGRIWVDVEQGKSTIFSMVLPVIQGAQGKQTRMQHAHV